MTYVIDPKLVYLMSVAGGLKTIAIILAVLAGLAWIIFVGTYFYNSYQVKEYDRDINKIYEKLCKKWMIVCLALFIMLSILVVVTPDRYTMIEMFIAKTATVENLSMGVDAIKEATDYVINAINTLK